MYPSLFFTSCTIFLSPVFLPMLSLSLTAGRPLAVAILMTMLSGLDFLPSDLFVKSSASRTVSETVDWGLDGIELTGEESPDTEDGGEASLLSNGLVLEAVLDVERI